MQIRALRDATSILSGPRWRTYSLFAFGVLTSSLGDRMAVVAIVALFYQRTGHGVAVGVALALFFAPTMLFSMVGGYLADRYPRPLVVIASHLGGAVAALALALDPPLPATLPLVFALGTSAAISIPAVRALIADLVPGEEALTRGNAVYNFFYNACFFAGPYVAGVIFAVRGAGLVFVLDAISFLVSAAALTIVARRPAGTGAPAPREPRDSSPRARLAAALSGVTILWSSPKPRGIAVTIVAVVLAGGAMSGALIGVAERVFHAGSVGFGTLAASTGLGLLLGSLALMLRPPVSVDRWLARGIALMALGYAAVAGAPVLPLAAAGLVVSGVGNSMQNLANSVVIQRSLPRAEHGRAFGGLFMFSNLAQVPGLIAGGALLDVAPVRLVALGCALLMAGAVAVAWLLVSSPLATPAPATQTGDGCPESR
jgi:MFS family permease